MALYIFIRAVPIVLGVGGGGGGGEGGGGNEENSGGSREREWSLVHGPSCIKSPKSVGL